MSRHNMTIRWFGLGFFFLLLSVALPQPTYAQKINMPKAQVRYLWHWLKAVARHPTPPYKPSK